MHGLYTESYIYTKLIGDPPDRRQPLGNPEIKITVGIGYSVGV